MRKDITISLYPDDIDDYLILNNVPYHCMINFGELNFSEEQVLELFETIIPEANKHTATYINADMSETVNTVLYHTDFAIKYTKKLHNPTETDDDNIEINDSEVTDKIVLKNIIIYYNDQTQDKAFELKEKLTSCLYKDERTYFMTIGVDRYGYRFEKTLLDIDGIKPEIVNQNYGSEFKTKYLDLIESLNKETKGLYLFHGFPGCGKTYLIRLLIAEMSKNKNKKVVVIPSIMLDHLSKPEFIMFLKNYKNLVLIIEDAEFALKSRETSNGNDVAISNILNITDGLFNDVIQAQLICTFNTNLTNIDKALLRPGRLKFMHEFKKLNRDEVKEVCKYLDIEPIDESDLSLAEIYNYSDSKKLNTDQTKQKIGFGK